MAEWLTKEERKKRINKIRELSGDENRLELVYIVWTPCGSCGFDPIKQEAKDSACLECGGSGRTATESIINLLAKVRWIDPMEETMMKTGYLPTGGVSFTVDSVFEPSVDSAEKIRVDGIEVKIVSKRYRGFPEVNRLTVIAEPVNK